MTDHDDHGPEPGGASPTALDELAPVVQAALEARAATASADPAAWDRIVEQRRRGAGPRPGPGSVTALRRHGPLLVLAAAAVAAVLIGALLRVDETSQEVRTGDPNATRPVRPDASSPVPAPAGPEEVQTGPGEPTTTVAPGTGSIRDVDLRNATYPVGVCFEGLGPPGDTFTLHDGTSAGPGTVVNLTAVAYGDVTGDGREDVAVVIYCGPPNSDAGDGVVALLDVVDGGRLSVLATLASSGADVSGTFVVQPVDPRGEVTTRTEAMDERPSRLAVTGGRLTVTWYLGGLAGGDATGAYDLDVTYRWDGTGLRPAQVGERRLVQPAPLDPGAMAYYGLRQAGIPSMTLPLATEGRDPRAALCADLFAPFGPLRDVALVDGTAAVVGADGQPRAATVTLLGVYYVDFTVPPGGTQDAVVVLSCNTDTAAAGVPTLVRLVGGRPTVVDVVPRPGPRATASGRLGEPRSWNTVSVFWLGVYEDSPASTSEIVYRWDGAHLVPV
jgi:hypothetical protein